MHSDVGVRREDDCEILPNPISTGAHTYRGHMSIHMTRLASVIRKACRIGTYLQNGLSFLVLLVVLVVLRPAFSRSYCVLLYKIAVDCMEILDDDSLRPIRLNTMTT